jgi:hypothetical protein
MSGISERKNIIIGVYKKQPHRIKLLKPKYRPNKPTVKIVSQTIVAVTLKPSLPKHP